jgi:uncharacterized protein YbaR (Trm112 family)
MKKQIIKIITCPECNGNKKVIKKSCRCDDCSVIETCTNCAGKGEIKIIPEKRFE